MGGRTRSHRPNHQNKKRPARVPKHEGEQNRTIRSLDINPKKTNIFIPLWLDEGLCLYICTQKGQINMRTTLYLVRCLILRLDYHYVYYNRLRLSSEKPNMGTRAARVSGLFFEWFSSSCHETFFRIPKEYGKPTKHYVYWVSGPHSCGFPAGWPCRFDPKVRHLGGPLPLIKVVPNASGVPAPPQTTTLPARNVTTHIHTHIHIHSNWARW